MYIAVKMHLNFYLTCFTFILISPLHQVRGWVGDSIANTVCSTFYSECCRFPYIKRNSAVKDLKKVLQNQFFGQHIAVETVLTALNAHLKDDKPKKPLVFSFHGWSGSGKTYLSELISQALYEKGAESQYVKRYTSSVHFPDVQYVTEYKRNLQKDIVVTLSSCEDALFIFDEVDSTPQKLFDSLTGYMDHMNTVKGINHKKAIYIFVSNIGADEITKICMKAWSEGKRREELTITDFHDILSKISFNANETGFDKAKIIDRVLVDFFIPFLPMERRHVLQCAKVELERYNSSIDPELIAGNLSYWPHDIKAFSRTGCKRVNLLVKTQVSAKELRDEL